MCACFTVERVGSFLAQAYGTTFSSGFRLRGCIHSSLHLPAKFDQDHQLIEVPPLQVSFECPRIELEDIPLWTFLAGVLCAPLLGPLIDCLSLARQRWRRFVLNAFAQERRGGRQPRDSSRPLHKVIALAKGLDQQAPSPKLGCVRKSGF